MYLSICTIRLITSNSTDFLLLVCWIFLDLLGSCDKKRQINTAVYTIQEILYVCITRSFPVLL